MLLAKAGSPATVLETTSLSTLKNKLTQTNPAGGRVCCIGFTTYLLKTGRLSKPDGNTRIEPAVIRPFIFPSPVMTVIMTIITIIVMKPAIIATVIKTPVIFMGITVILVIAITLLITIVSLLRLAVSPIGLAVSTR